MLESSRAAGFSGVNNFPTVGLFDGRIRQELEASGMGFEREVEMIKTADELGFYAAYSVDETWWKDPFVVFAALIPARSPS